MIFICAFLLIPNFVFCLFLLAPIPSICFPRFFPVADHLDPQVYNIGSKGPAAAPVSAMAMVLGEGCR
jgi:hypothetical protein